VTTVLNTVIPILAGICLIVALYFIAKGVRARVSVSEYAYGVQRQEARQSMAVAFARGFALLLVGLILLAIFGLSPRPQMAEAEPTAPALPSATFTSQPAATNTPTTLQQIVSTPTSPVPTATVGPTDTPEPTDTPVVPTAVVNSFNGLWLREAPGGTQELELIPNGTALTLLEGRETTDDLEWQQVRTPSGNEGWVAAEFLVYE